MEKIRPLEQSDRIHLNAASGWLGLGDFTSANEELDQISPMMRAHPAVLLARCEVYFAAKKWEIILPIAETLIKQLPKLNQAWIQRSFALHKLKRTQEAFDSLLPAAKKFPKLETIPYNLACYCSQLGRLKEALRWIECAIDLSPGAQIKLTALDDRDLEPLWAQIGEI